MSSILEDISALKRNRSVIFAAHLYQPLEIQLMADIVGDSFELAKKCVASGQNEILFCGVKFMGESAKILCPEKRVYVPAPDATCAMAEMITANDVLKLKEENPNAAVVCYINSSASVKAVSDICCTSSNAERVIASLKSKKIIFVPDKNLGAFIAKKFPEKEFVFFNGYCPVHNFVDINAVEEMKKLHPYAPLLTHPECPANITEISDYVGSTSGIINFVLGSTLKEFIICTEQGVVDRLAMLCPGKQFYLASPKLYCGDMKKITPQNIQSSLLNGTGEIILDSNTISSAQLCLQRMMNI